MHADFGRPQGVLSSVLSVVAVIVGATGLFVALSASRMKSELNVRIAALEDRVTEAGQLAESLKGEARRIEVQNQSALIAVGRSITALEARLSAPASSGTGATVRTPAPAATGSTSAAASAAPAGIATYTVKSGDTLSRIAQQQGTTVDKLTDLNPALDPRKLRVGAKIKVPGASR